MSDGSVTIDTRLNKSEFTRGIKQLESIGKKGLKTIGVAAGTAVAGLTALGTYATKVGSDFEAGMSKVQAISGATGDELDKLTAKAKEMGAKTKFSATESAEAFQYMAMAGWKTEDMLNGIEGIMNLAAASGENLASVSDIVTDALTAFGLQAKDSAHFADVLAKASSNSNTNVSMMGATFKYVAPIAGSLKYSIEDAAVAIGLMANAGIKGEQAGTALRAMLTRLVKPPKDAAGALDALKISAKNADGTMKPLSSVLQELREKFKKLDDSQKASYASSIAGTEAMSGMLSIVNASDADFQKLTASINNADGAASEMADTMNNNLQGATTIFKSNVESLGVAIYDKFKGPATEGVKSLTKSMEELTKSATNGKLSKSIDKLASSFSKLISKSGKLLEKLLPKLVDGLSWIIDNGKTIAKVIGAMATAMIAFKTASKLETVIKSFMKLTAQVILSTSATKGATAAQKLLNLAQSASPIGLLITAVAALAAGLTYLASKQSEAQKEAKEFADEMSTQRKELEEYNASIDKTANANLAHINSIEKLKDELKTLVDENGKVKDGYKGRVDFILNELNAALETEYKRNGDIIQGYKDLQAEIDKTIEKKKAQIILNASEEKYKNAIEKQEQAVEDLKNAYDKLAMPIDEAKRKYQEYLDVINNPNSVPMDKFTEMAVIHKDEMETLGGLIAGYEEAENSVKIYTENVKDYENKYALWAEGKYSELANAITTTTEEWCDKSLEDIKKGLEEQSKELKYYQEAYKKHGNEIEKQRAEQAQKNLDNLVAELVERTSRTEELSQDEIEAWRKCGEGAYEVYSAEIVKMGPEVQKRIEEATGIIAQEAPKMQEEAKKLIEETLAEFDKSPEARQKALNTLTGYLNGLTDDEKRELLKKAGIENVDAVLKELEQGKLSEENGKNILQGLLNGLNNGGLQSKILGVATRLAQKVNQAFTGKSGWDEHSPSKKMKKFAEYYVQPISDVMKKKEGKIVGASEGLAERVNKAFSDLEVDRLYKEMRSAVDFETQQFNSKVRASANLKANKDSIRTINNDNGVSINNTQNFYEKQATPYEEQRQAKQQLRRLAYGL